MVIRLHNDSCRLVLALLGLLVLGACAVTSAEGPPGKSPARFSSENRLCEGNASRAPFNAREKVYAQCMLALGNIVHLHDGRVLEPDAYRQPRAQAFAQPGPSVGQRELDDKYASKVEAIISHDAQGWLANKYDAGSVHNVQVIESQGKPAEMRAEYTYNSGNRGWVHIDFRPKTPCLEYWDMEGECRPITVSRVAQFEAMTRAMKQAQAKSSSEGRGRSDPGLCFAEVSSCESQCTGPFSSSGFFSSIGGGPNIASVLSAGDCKSDCAAKYRACLGR